MTATRGAVWAAGVILAAAFFSGTAFAHNQGVTVQGGTRGACPANEIEKGWNFFGSPRPDPVAYCYALTQSGCNAPNTGHCKGTLTYAGTDATSATCTWIQGTSDTNLPQSTSAIGTLSCGSPSSCPSAGTAYGSFHDGQSGSGSTFSESDVGMTGCVNHMGLLCGIVVKRVDKLVFSETDYEVFRDWEYTGATCSTQSEPTGQMEITEDVNPDPQLREEGVCREGSSETVCVSKEEKNCGYVNGSRVCLGDSGLNESNPCHQNPNGTVFCIGSASGGVVPDSGATNTPADPDAELGLTQEGQSTTTVYYYNSSTVANSTNYGDGPGGNLGGGDGGGNAVCGAPPLPACDVEIGEEGMPGLPSFGEWNGGTGEVGGAASDNPADGWNLPGIMPDLADSTCQSITLTYFGRELVFPGTKGCDWIEDLKALLAWFLYAMTAALIGQTVIRSV